MHYIHPEKSINMIQLESFHSITILANLRRLYFIVITDPRNTTVRSVTLEYVGQTFRGHIRSQAFRPEGNSFLSGELRYIDGSACDKGTPGTPPPLKQAAIPLASTYSSSSFLVLLKNTTPFQSQSYCNRLFSLDITIKKILQARIGSDRWYSALRFSNPRIIMQL